MICDGFRRGSPRIARLGYRFENLHNFVSKSTQEAVEGQSETVGHQGVISGPPAIGFNHGSWFLRAGDHRFARNTKLVFSFVFTAFSVVHGHG